MPKIYLNSTNLSFRSFCSWKRKLRLAENFILPRANRGVSCLVFYSPCCPVVDYNRQLDYCGLYKLQSTTPSWSPVVCCSPPGRHSNVFEYIAPASKACCTCVQGSHIKPTKKMLSLQNVLNLVNPVYFMEQFGVCSRSGNRNRGKCLKRKYF